MSRILYGIYYSLWTRRARWALRHHEIAHKYREHVPFLGEPVLRLVSRGSGSNKATVPLLVDGNRKIADSWQIIEQADAIGSGPSLRATEPQVRAWRDRLEPAYDAARRRITWATLNEKDALTEAATAAAPKALAPLARPVAAAGARFIASKYGFDDQGDVDEQRGIMREALEAVRQGLGDGEYLVDNTFSAADIAAACLVFGVKPVADVPGMGPATRRIWTDPVLADEFRDLLAWRDALRDRH